MKLKKLERICTTRFGQEKGSKLAKVMAKMGRLDFCVATAWNADEISISRSCHHRGRIFKISNDYKKLILVEYNSKAKPKEVASMDMNSLDYNSIAKNLPNARFSLGYTNCHADQLI